MSKLLAIFKPRKLAVPENEVAVIAVPDIKDYLVREYERVNELKRQNEMLREQLELARELQKKYEAALVTLDECSKRQESAKIELRRERERTEKARQEADRYRDLVNTYKIQLNNAALTKEQIRDEIVSEVKNDLVERVASYKGTLSKQKVREMILGEVSEGDAGGG